MDVNMAVEVTVHENYGSEGDQEVYENAKALFGAAVPNAQMLIGSALELGHLDADGIIAMMRAAVNRALDNN